MKHFLSMLIGCGLPLLMIFLLPALGVGRGMTLTVFLVLMFVCHLMHLRFHSNHTHSNVEKHHEQQRSKKTG